MLRRALIVILASTYVGCVGDQAAPVIVAPVIATHTDETCGEVIPDRDALHALVESRIAEHSDAFAACAPGRERVVVRAEIMLNVCGRASLGTSTPDVAFTATEQCIDRVLDTILFASIGDMKFWHTHEFVFGEAAR